MKTISNKRERSFPFLRINERERKPRKHGLTEIRGPFVRIAPADARLHPPLVSLLDAETRVFK